MSHVDTDGVIIFQEDTEPLRDVDIIIFATGYNFSLPFCKVTDSPWDGTRILDGQVQSVERDGGSETEVGGMKGLGMEGLDPLLLFLDNEPSRTIAFPVLRMSPSYNYTAVSRVADEYQNIRLCHSHSQRRKRA